MGIIAAVAIGLSVISYQYSIWTSQQIALAGTNDLKDNARIQAHDLTKALENRLADVKNNLEILANAPSVIRAEYTAARPLVNTAEKATAGFTDSYFLIDQNGKLQWAGAFANPQVYDQYYGADRTDRPYFTEPQTNHQPFFSSLRESVDGVPRLYMSYPVLASDGSFRGVVVASIDLKSLAGTMSEQLLQPAESAISLIDKDGTILYTQNDALLGKNYFSSEVQTLLFSDYIPVTQQDAFNSVIRDSLAGNSGVTEYSVSGTERIMAYNPVIFDQGNGDNGQQALSLLLTMPKAFAGDISFLIEQQNRSIIVPSVIGSVAIGIALMVIRWNLRLEKTVKQRTAQLEAANEKLEKHDKAQREFINIAAHELRTPIQPLIGIANMLEAQFDRQGKGEIIVTKAEVDMITRNANRYSIFHLTSWKFPALRAIR